MVRYGWKFADQNPHQNDEVKLPGNAKQGRDQFGMVGVGRYVSKTDAGQGDAAKIDQVHVGGSRTTGTYPFEGVGIGIDKNLQQENRHFNKQQVATGRSGYDIDIDVTGADQKLDDFPKYKGKINHVGHIQGKHEIGNPWGKGQRNGKTKHEDKQEIAYDIFPLAFFNKHPYTGNAQNQHVDRPNHFGIQGEILQKNTNKKVLKQCKEQQFVFTSPQKLVKFWSYSGHEVNFRQPFSA